MVPVNIEFKAVSNNPNKIRELLNARNAEFRGKDHQIDTYFKVSSGRLKIREGNIETLLIHYERPDVADLKQSNVLLYPLDPANTPILKNILTKTLGILTVVDKEREIYFIENVKFHIDEVKNLGKFVEVEAIDSDGTIDTSKLQAQCDYYRNLFQIMNNDLIDVSYSDLLTIH